jgi:hypothetical protein
MFVNVPDAGAHVRRAGGAPPRALLDARGSGAYVRGTDANAVGTVPRVRIARGNVRGGLMAEWDAWAFSRGPNLKESGEIGEIGARRFCED